MFRIAGKTGGLLWAGIALAVLLLAATNDGWGVKVVASIEVKPRPLPEFTNSDPAAWINSPPLSVQDLRGKVVLIEVWTTS